MSETMEQWAARVAPMLDADGWRAAEEAAQFAVGVMTMWRPHEGAKVRTLRSDQARAMLAYRDSVVAGLTPAEQRFLRSHALPNRITPRLAVLNALEFDGLSMDGRTFTDFGREIARVLGGAK